MKKTLSACLLSIVFLTSCGSTVKVFDRNHEIHIVSREDGSGTRGAFAELTGIAQKEGDQTVDHTSVEAQITNSTSVVLTAVGGDQYSIGYLSLGSFNDSIKAVAVDTVLPTAETIKSGSYPVSRPFLLTYQGELSPQAQDFISFIVSDPGQTIVESNGYVAAHSGQGYTDKYLSGKIVIGGSSSVTPVIEKLKEEYIIFHPDVTIEVQQSDSTTGIASVISGNYDIGMSSRSLKDSEVQQGVVDRTIALDGIVVIVNPNNPIDKMTLEQVNQIFRGAIATWDALEEGGNHE